MRPYLTCDLDLTLCDTAVRDAAMDPFNPANLAAADPAFWEDYHSRCGSDTPLAGNVRLLVDLAGWCEVVFVSNRSDGARGATISWLIANVPIPGLVGWPLENNDPATSRLILHTPVGVKMADPVEEKVAKVVRVVAARGAGHVFHLDDQAAVIGRLAARGLAGRLPEERRPA